MAEQNFINWKPLSQAYHSMNRTWKTLAIVSFISIIVEIIYVAYVFPWGKLDVTISAYWVGAIGSFGAWIGTILIATSERRERNRKELNMALNVSGGVLLKIMEIRNVAKSVGEQMLAQETLSKACIAYYALQLRQLPNLEYVETAALSILPQNFTSKLVTISSEIDWCKRSLNEWDFQDEEKVTQASVDHFNDIAARLIDIKSRIANYEKEIISFLAKHNCAII